MSSVTAQLTAQAKPAWQAHPLYRAWKALLALPEVAALRVSLYRPREGLTYAPTKLYVATVLTDGTVREPVEYAWDPVANAGLVRLHARCAEQAEESMRFALMAKKVFLPIEVRVGDGFFNSVFLPVMRSQFTELPQLTRMLAQVTRDYRTEPGTAFDECAEQIRNAVAELSRDLTATDRLAYPPETADAILDGALAQYVDERFNVTNRSLLHW